MRRASGFERTLDGYRLRMREEREKSLSLSPEEFSRRRDEFLLPVGEEVGEFLIDLAVGLQAKRIVELGTSYGFSTLYLAEAARRTGGRVATYDLSTDKQAYARDRMGEAGLGGGFRPPVARGAERDAPGVQLGRDRVAGVAGSIEAPGVLGNGKGRRSGQCEP